MGKFHLILPEFDAEICLLCLLVILRFFWSGDGGVDKFVGILQEILKEIYL